MKKILLLTIFFHCILVNANESKTFYVSGDVVNVRKEPKTNSSIICQLRIGNIILSTKQSDGWIYIDSVKASSKYNAPSVAIEGWISEKLCSSVRFTTKALVASLKKAETLADSILWYQRLVAMEPQDLSYARALHTCYLASGDKDKAEAIEQKINGTETIYLALKKADQLQVIGYIDEYGNFNSLYWKETQDYNEKGDPYWKIWNEEDRKTKEQVLRLKSHLSGLLWYGGPVNGGSRQFPVTYIIPEESIKRDNKISFGGESGYYMDIEGTISCCLSLGPTLKYYSNLYATKPYQRIQSAGIKSKKMLDSIDWYKNKLVGTAIDHFGISRISFNQLPEYNLIDISIGGRVDYYENVGTQRGIFQNKTHLVWPPKGYYAMDVFDWELSWFRFGENDTYPVYTIVSFKDSKPGSNGNKGLQLLEVDKEGAEIFLINSEYFGD